MNPAILEILACPFCVTHPTTPPAGKRKGELTLLTGVSGPEALSCQQCQRRYPIEDGLPKLLIDAATLPEAGG